MKKMKKQNKHPYCALSLRPHGTMVSLNTAAVAGVVAAAAFYFFLALPSLLAPEALLSTGPCDVHLMGAADDRYALWWAASAASAALMLGVRSATVVVPPDAHGGAPWVRHVALPLVRYVTGGRLDVRVVAMDDADWATFRNVFAVSQSTASGAGDMAPHLAGAAGAPLGVAKLLLHRLAPAHVEQVLYLDADTVVGRGSDAMRATLARSTVLCRPVRALGVAEPTRHPTAAELGVPLLKSASPDAADAEASEERECDAQLADAANRRRPDDRWFNSGVLKLNVTWWAAQRCVHATLRRYAAAGAAVATPLFDQTMLNMLVPRRWQQYFPAECNTPVAPPYHDAAAAVAATVSMQYVQRWPRCVNCCVCHWAGARAK
jgi:hypothetical protein